MEKATFHQYENYCLRESAGSISVQIWPNDPYQELTENKVIIVKTNSGELAGISLDSRKDLPLFERVQVREISRAENDIFPGNAFMYIDASQNK